MVENKTLVAGTFVMISLILSGTYFIADADKSKAYYCSSNDLIGICDKLTTNDTRCYFSVDGRTTYKGCSSGWTKMTFNDTAKANSLCYSPGENTYCCESSQLEKGVCDFIIRK